MDNIEAMVNPTSIFLLGITNIMFLLAKIHPSTFWGHFLIFHQTSQKKFHFFRKICWGFTGGSLGVRWGFTGGSANFWGFAGGSVKNVFGEEHIYVRNV